MCPFVNGLVRLWAFFEKHAQVLKALSRFIFYMLTLKMAMLADRAHHHHHTAKISHDMPTQQEMKPVVLWHTHVGRTSK